MSPALIASAAAKLIARPPGDDDRVATIRAAVSADAGEMLTVQRAAWVSEAQLHGTTELPPLTQTLAELQDELETRHALVAVDGHRIVGIVRAFRDDDVWRIGRLGVVPDRQGAGIGSRLLAAIEGAAPPDVRAFALFTGPRSARNVTLYERAGYRRVPSGDGLIHLRKERRSGQARAG